MKYKCATVHALCCAGEAPPPEKEKPPSVYNLYLCPSLASILVPSLENTIGLTFVFAKVFTGLWSDCGAVEECFRLFTKGVESVVLVGYVRGNPYRETSLPNIFAFIQSTMTRIRFLERARQLSATIRAI